MLLWMSMWHLFLESHFYFLIPFLLIPLHRDGTSIVLSDDVGQLYFLSTGQGESQKDAKYDQVLKETTPFL